MLEDKMRLKKIISEKIELLKYKRGGFKKIKKKGKVRGVVFALIAFRLLLKESRKFVEK